MRIIILSFFFAWPTFAFSDQSVDVAQVRALYSLFALGKPVAGSQESVTVRGEIVNTAYNIQIYNFTVFYNPGDPKAPFKIYQITNEHFTNEQIYKMPHMHLAPLMNVGLFEVRGTATRLDIERQELSGHVEFYLLSLEAPPILVPEAHK